MDRLTIAEQTRVFLKQAIAEGRWAGRLPSERRLSAELKVARMTLVKALNRLEAEGVLARDPTSKSGVRRIVPDAPVKKKSVLRVGILCPMSAESESEILFQNRMLLMRELEGRGHVAVVTHHATGSGPLRARRLALQVDAARADAWVVIGGTHAMLTWFDARKEPVIRYGEPAEGFSRLSFSGYRAASGLCVGTKRILELGHTRVVLVAPRRFRDGRFRESLPGYAALLEGAGIACDDYHVPDWDDTPAGLEKLLTSLFRFTPPTALIVWNGIFASGVLAFLARRHLKVPEDISLFVLEYPERLAWLEPAIDFAHLDFDRQLSSRNILRWLERVAEGRPTVRSYVFEGKFHEGRSLAPPASGRSKAAPASVPVASRIKTPARG